MREGDDSVTTTAASLRVLGTVGEPINPEAWNWYHIVVGEGAARSWTRGGRPKPAASDYTAAGRDRAETGFSNRSRSSAFNPLLVDCTAIVSRCGEGNLCITDSLARPDAHRLWRSRPLCRDLFFTLSRKLFHGRRLPPRCRRLLLDHRPR